MQIDILIKYVLTIGVDRLINLTIRSNGHEDVKVNKLELNIYIYKSVLEKVNRD